MFRLKNFNLNMKLDRHEFCPIKIDEFCRAKQTNTFVLNCILMRIVSVIVVLQMGKRMYLKQGQQWSRHRYHLFYVAKVNIHRRVCACVNTNAYRTYTPMQASKQISLKTDTKEKEQHIWPLFPHHFLAAKLFVPLLLCEQYVGTMFAEFLLFYCTQKRTKWLIWNETKWTKTQKEPFFSTKKAAMASIIRWNKGKRRKIWSSEYFTAHHRVQQMEWNGIERAVDRSLPLSKIFQL